MPTIYDDLYQFTDYIEPINLSFNQYLLLTEEPVLIHTGTAKQAEAMVPQLRHLLGRRPLKYVFVSHFEADECGGLSILVREFPQEATVCSQTTARQLAGFNITSAAMVKKPGDILAGGGYEFQFVGYPSELHLQDGLLFVEANRGIFFSSDLMFRLGDAHGEVIQSDWRTEVESCGADRVPDAQRRENLIDNLMTLSPKFIAAGHGPCVKLR
jgi:flavorubredoxin